MKRFIIGGIFFLFVFVAGCSFKPRNFPTAPTTLTPGGQVTVPAGTATQAGNPIPQTGMEELNTFSQNLANAVETKDFNALRSMMGNSFALAGWRSEGRSLTPDQAMQELQATYLAPVSQPKADFTQDVAALLGGTDPLAVMSPDGSGVRAVFVRGLGAQAADEGLFIISRDPASRKLYLQGLLTAANGFIDQPAGNLPTNVTYIQVNDDVNLRTGPGTQYPSLGLVFAGMGLEVTGKSQDGAWWQVRCEQAPSGQCWVSADPALTSPAQKP